MTIYSLDHTVFDNASFGLPAFSNCETHMINTQQLVRGCRSWHADCMCMGSVQSVEAAATGLIPKDRIFLISPARRCGRELERKCPLVHLNRKTWWFRMMTSQNQLDHIGSRRISRVSPTTSFEVACMSNAGIYSSG